MTTTVDPLRAEPSLAFCWCCERRVYPGVGGRYACAACGCRGNILPGDRSASFTEETFAFQGLNGRHTRERYTDHAHENVPSPA